MGSRGWLRDGLEYNRWACCCPLCHGTPIRLFWDFLGRLFFPLPLATAIVKPMVDRVCMGEINLHCWDDNAGTDNQLESSVLSREVQSYLGITSIVLYTLLIHRSDAPTQPRHSQLPLIHGKACPNSTVGHCFGLDRDASFRPCHTIKDSLSGSKRI